MTWVIGASTVWGYGVLISDVQVAFRDGTTTDILQKAYPLSNFVVGGFAGSVKIGFALLQSMKNMLRMPDELLATHAWDPFWIAAQWPTVARATFERMEKSEQALGAQILIVAAHPARTHAFGSEVVFIRFAAPTFNPGVMTRATKVCSIGSGAGVAEYKRSLKPLFRFGSGIWQGEVGVTGGWGRMLVYAVSGILNRNPRRGISRHLHHFDVRNGAISMGNNDETIYPRDSDPIVIKMPAVARGYEQFLKLAENRNLNSAEATC